MTLLQNQRKGDGVAGGLPIHLVLQVLRIEGPGAAVQPTRHMRATARMQADKRATGLLVCMGISSMTAASMIGESPGKGKSQPAEGRLGFGRKTRPWWGLLGGSAVVTGLVAYLLEHQGALLAALGELEGDVAVPVDLAHHLVVRRGAREGDALAVVGLPRERGRTLPLVRDVGRRQDAGAVALEVEGEAQSRLVDRGLVVLVRDMRHLAVLLREVLVVQLIGAGELGGIVLGLRLRVVGLRLLLRRLGRAGIVVGDLRGEQIAARKCEYQHGAGEHGANLL